MASIGAIPSSTSAGSGASGVGLQDFLRILLTQLTYQDPLKPMDNQQFMAQIAQFTTLEQTQQLNNRLDALLTTQASLQSVGLIGRTVDVATSSGELTGTVTALALRGDTPLVTVRTTSGATLSDIALSQIAAVR